MHGKAICKNPNEVNFSVTLDAPATEFEAMLEQIDSMSNGKVLGWPLCDLRDVLRQVTHDARKTFGWFSAGTGEKAK